MKYIVVKYDGWGGKPKEVKEFSTFIGAFRYCTQKNWQIIDDDGFIWDLDIKEKY